MYQWPSEAASTVTARHVQITSSSPQAFRGNAGKISVKGTEAPSGAATAARSRQETADCAEIMCRVQILTLCLSFFF